MKRLILPFLLSLLIAQVLAFTPSRAQVKDPIVFLFIIDGLMPDAAQLAMDNGAHNMAFFKANGVVVDTALCLSPAGKAVLPDGTMPWGGATPPNLGMHTGTHLFETLAIDDIFRSARRQGIKSVFSGGHDLYQDFKTPDYTYVQTGYSDSVVVDLVLQHLGDENVRLFRLHLQEIRYSWEGPEQKMNPLSPYQQGIQNADRQLGRLVQAVKDKGLWERSFFIITSDHGMGQLNVSRHYATDLSSWQIYMNFYGPGVKQGAHIPYAESPDIALTVNDMLDCEPLQGYQAGVDSLTQLKPTGVLLQNIYNNQSQTIDHHRMVKRYLKSTDWKPEKSYLHYRQAMFDFLNEKQ